MRRVNYVRYFTQCLSGGTAAVKRGPYHLMDHQNYSAEVQTGCDPYFTHNIPKADCCTLDRL